MSLPLIYIAGPFRAPTPYEVRLNVERARDLGLCVARLGGYPVIPHTMTCDFDKQLTDRFWLEGTLTLMQRCNAIVFTPNYLQSRGARAEEAAWGDPDTRFYSQFDSWHEVFALWVKAWKANRS